jgi:hypothetical protein
MYVLYFNQSNVALHQWWLVRYFSMAASGNRKAM